jgi:hypothetical protein
MWREKRTKMEIDGYCDHNGWADVGKEGLRNRLML